MLTTIILDGEMGKLFGREHRLNIKSPNQALRLININQGGLLEWIRDNAKKFNAYRIICEYFDGRKEEVSEQTYMMRRANVKSIRFTPVVAGAGGNGIFQTIVGVVMIVVGVVIGNPYVTQIGIAMALGGVSQMLAPKPKTNGGKDDVGKSDSHYFSGAENNTNQGQPVPLIYGRIRTGAQAISAAQTVDQLK